MTVPKTFRLRSRLTVLTSKQFFNYSSVVPANIWNDLLVFQNATFNVNVVQLYL